MSTVRKRRLPARKPVDRCYNGEDLEELVLHKIDTFLYTLETRMDSIEEYGLEKLDILDSSVRHAYEQLVKVRDDVVVEGKHAVEVLIQVVTAMPKTEDFSTAIPISEMVSSGVTQLEGKLVYLEDYVRESTLKKSIERALQAAANRLLTFEELPLPWQENPYITRGYRFCKDYKSCICSVMKVHNETCNIWTHAGGLVFMLAASLYHLPSTEAWKNSTAWDKAIMIVFLVAACKCLACSAVWHTFSGICRLNVKKGFACVDYMGITVLIAASILTTEYAALYCHTTARNVYMAITTASAIGGVFMNWHPCFDEPSFKAKRVAFFVGFAVAGILGFVHAAFYHGLGPTWWFYYPITKSLACYILGVVAYLLLFPEKYFKNSKFLAYIGASHNLWHICVFGGIYYHYMATVHFLQNGEQFSCPTRSILQAHV